MSKRVNAISVGKINQMSWADRMVMRMAGAADKALHDEEAYAVKGHEYVIEAVRDEFDYICDQRCNKGVGHCDGCPVWQAYNELAGE